MHKVHAEWPCDEVGATGMDILPERDGIVDAARGEGVWGAGGSSLKGMRDEGATLIGHPRSDSPGCRRVVSRRGVGTPIGRGIGATKGVDTGVDPGYDR